MEIRSAEAEATNARLAHFLLQARAVCERDVPTHWQDPLMVCEAGLQHWLDRQVGPLRCLSPVFIASLQCGDTPYVADAPARANGLCIRWGERQVFRWNVGDGLEWLERRTPGLGASILAALGCRGADAYPVFTPSIAREAASYLYWYGEVDETLALEDLGDSEEEREAMRAEMVTLDMVRAAFPDWALDPPPRPVALKLLRHTAAGDDVPFDVRRVAALAAELAGLPDGAKYAPEADGPFIGFGAVLCWRTDDLARRLSDDWAQNAWQDGHVDHAGEILLALDDPAAMRLWRRGMRPVMRAISIIDALIWWLAEGYCTQVTERRYGG